MGKTNHISVGNAGEYFVAGELERHGFSVAVPMSNVKDFDLLAINRETLKKFAIQVKTTHFKRKEWTLNQKNEQLSHEDVFYVFVTLNDLEAPEYHIVPSRVVAKQISKGYRRWLATPGKHGQKHNENTMRKFDDFDDIYLDRWDLLK